MRIILLWTFIIISTHQVLAQNDSANYRFGFSVSAMSTMNYGFKTFYDLETSSSSEAESRKIYKNEKYTVDYQNFNFSKDIDIQLSVNWINNDDYMLRQSFSFFYGSATERATLILTSYGEKTGVENFHPEYQFWADNLAVGYQTSFELKSTYFGFYNELILFKKLKNNFNVGVGISVVGRSRNEWVPRFAPGYLEHYIFDHFDDYYTRQLCVSGQVEKYFGQFSGFINLSQSVLTIKKFKGHLQLDDGELVARSNNLDYRFPLYIKAGLTVNFKKIKK